MGLYKIVKLVPPPKTNCPFYLPPKALETPLNEPFWNACSNVETVGLDLTGVVMVSFKLVYPNLPLTVLLVDLSFWAKLCGRFLAFGDGVNGIRGPNGGIFERLTE